MADKGFCINIINTHLTKGHPGSIPRKHMPELLSKATRWPAANWQEGLVQGRPSEPAMLLKPNAESKLYLYD